MSDSTFASTFEILLILTNIKKRKIIEEHPIHHHTQQIVAEKFTFVKISGSTLTWHTPAVTHYCFTGELIRVNANILSQ